MWFGFCLLLGVSTEHCFVLTDLFGGLYQETSSYDLD